MLRQIFLATTSLLMLNSGVFASDNDSIISSEWSLSRDDQADEYRQLVPYSAYVPSNTTDADADSFAYGATPQERKDAYEQAVTDYNNSYPYTYTY